MSEEKPGNNGHEQAAGHEQAKPKIMKLMEIFLSEDGKVFVKGPLGEQKDTCLKALGESVKIVTDFHKPVIVKPDFMGGIRKLLRK